MSYFAGIDLHKRYLTLCVLDQIAHVVVQHRRLTTDGSSRPGELDGPIAVAVEATLHWAWLHDRLAAKGYSAQVADPAGKLCPGWLQDRSHRCPEARRPASLQPVPATGLGSHLPGPPQGPEWICFPCPQSHPHQEPHPRLPGRDQPSQSCHRSLRQAGPNLDRISHPARRGQLSRYGLLELPTSSRSGSGVAKRIERRVEITPEGQLLLSAPASGPRPPCSSWRRSETSLGFPLPTTSPASPASCPQPGETRSPARMCSPVATRG